MVVWGEFGGVVVWGVLCGESLGCGCEERVCVVVWGEFGVW